MTTATANKKEISSTLWEFTPPKNVDFSRKEEFDNAVIDAYSKGVAKGSRSYEERAKAVFKINFEKSAVITGKIIDHLSKNGFKPFSAHLKVCSVFEFRVIILVKEEDFLSENFLNMYSFVGKFEKRCLKESFNLTFSFAQKGSNFNEKKLVSEGYRSPLVRNRNAGKTR